ncbi:hypothetical protein ABFX02_08G086900 [Erythranthe guttata]
MSHSTLSIILYSLLIMLLSSYNSNAQTTVKCFRPTTTPPKPQSFIFPIKKDATTNQYYTTIQIGSKATTLDVVIDLGGKFLYFYSEDYFNAASSYRPIPCGTRKCRTVVDTDGCVVFCNTSPPAPGCTNNTCADYALNPFTGTQGYNGLGEDALRVRSTRGSGRYYTVNNFPFQYSDPVLKDELASSTAGVIGLGRSKISLPAQLSSPFMIRRKFGLCVPSSGGGNGNMIVGETTYYENSNKSLIFTTTPLVKNHGSKLNKGVLGFIGVRSIKVGSKTLSLNKTMLSIDESNDGSGGTSIQTVRPYTTLQRPLYRALVKEFVKAARAKNITRVKSVAPFGACFDSKSVIVSSKTGPQVPTIDFVMQKKSVYWRFYGSNSMVKVARKDVICLAFVEGEINIAGPTTSIEVGGYQMENYLLEFDLASSKFGFSSSLSLHDTTCSKFLS